MPNSDTTFNGPAIADALNSDAPLLLRPKEAAKALAISDRKLWSLTAGREIPCVRIGKSVRYDPADLRTWIDSQKVPAIAC
jgi:excisionase family DNA binding protein